MAKTTPKKVATKTTAKTAVKEEAKKPRLSFMWQIVITGVIAAILLIVANSAIWVNQTIFNTDTFTQTAVTSLTSDSSRQALASEVVDRALADRPVIKNIAGNTATKLVSGLLGTNQFNRALTVSMSKLQVYLTSKDQKSITLDLTGIKGIVDKLVTVADNNGVENADNAQARLSTVPDQIVLVDANNIPSFYTYGLIFLWVAPICVLLAAGLLAYPYLKKRIAYYRIAWVQGLIIVVAGFMSLLVGPLFRPPVLANVTSGNMRVVVGNLFDAFVNIFNHQAYVMIAIGVMLAVLPALFNASASYYHKRATAKR